MQPSPLVKKLDIFKHSQFDSKWKLRIIIVNIEVDPALSQL